MHRHTLFSLVLFAIALIGGISTASAQEVGIIKLLNIRGDVTVAGAPATGKTMEVRVGQSIETGGNGSAILFFSNGSTLSISKDSKLTVEQFSQTDHNVADLSELAAEPSTSNTKLSMAYGEVIGEVKKLNRNAGSTFEVDTPVGIAGIRGTTFLIQLIINAMSNQIDLFFACERGEVTFTPLGEAMVNALNILGGNKVEIKLVDNKLVAEPRVENLDKRVTDRINRALQSVNNAIQQALGEGSDKPERDRPIGPGDPSDTDDDPSPFRGTSAPNDSKETEIEE